MIKIINNPNPTEDKECTCNACGCTFAYSKGDTYIKTYFGTGFDPICVKCPNCGKDLLA